MANPSSHPPIHRRCAGVQLLWGGHEPISSQCRICHSTAIDADGQTTLIAWPCADAFWLAGICNEPLSISAGANTKWRLKSPPLGGPAGGKGDWDSGEEGDLWISRGAPPKRPPAHTSQRAPCDGSTCESLSRAGGIQGLCRPVASPVSGTVFPSSRSSSPKLEPDSSSGCLLEIRNEDVSRPVARAHTHTHTHTHNRFFTCSPSI